MANQPHSVPSVGPVPTQVALGAAVSPDGKYIQTASGDNTARLWLTDYQDAIHAVCALLARDFTPEERT